MKFFLTFALLWITTHGISIDNRYDFVLIAVNSLVKNLIGDRNNFITIISPFFANILSVSVICIVYDNHVINQIGYIHISEKFITFS